MPPFVLVGRVVKPHGIRGELVVEPLSDVPDRFAPGTPIRVGELDTEVTRSRPHQGRLLLAVADIEDRSAAERLRGMEVHAPPLDEDHFDTYFAHELVGAEVVLEDDGPVGTVAGLYELPAAAGYELLEVARPDGSTVLVPAVEELVVAREDDAGGLQLVVVDPPEGLLD